MLDFFDHAVFWAKGVEADVYTTEDLELNFQVLCVHFENGVFDLINVLLGVKVRCLYQVFEIGEYRNDLSLNVFRDSFPELVEHLRGLITPVINNTNDMHHLNIQHNVIVNILLNIIPLYTFLHSLQLLILGG